jgi:ubiquinone/menaquinone biosynthesis C-methylase UbiE
MVRPDMNEIAAQRAYYERTAADYDGMHAAALDGDHFVALAWLSAIVDMTGARSILDVGTGTGRALRWLRDRHPGLAIRGIEPVEGLRRQAHRAGLGPDVVVDGDATRLPFADDGFDIVCAFGVLHHIRDDEAAVAEMARVARLGVFISDSNNYGQGGRLARRVKQALRALRLWGAADYVNSRGKGHHWSEGDGIYYSYSVFDSLPILRRKFANTYFAPTRGNGPDLYRDHGHVAVFAADRLVAES